MVTTAISGLPGRTYRLSTRLSGFVNGVSLEHVHNHRHTTCSSSIMQPLHNKDESDSDSDSEDLDYVPPAEGAYQEFLWWQASVVLTRNLRTF